MCLPLHQFYFKIIVHSFYNVCYLQCLFLIENNIITDDAQRTNTVYTYQLKSFEHKNVMLYQVFLRKSGKLISAGGILTRARNRKYFRRKVDSYSGPKSV